MILVEMLCPRVGDNSGGKDPTHNEAPETASTSNMMGRTAKWESSRIASLEAWGWYVIADIYFVGDDQ